MATTLTDTDVLLSIYSQKFHGSIGQKSIYTDVPHPGTNKTIQGWKWDERLWPSNEEFDSIAVAPSIWDPEASGLNNVYWQSGYGDEKDLLLLGVNERLSASGLLYWAPKVNHGYYYTYSDEFYLYSDSYQTEKFSSSNTVSGMMYLDMNYKYKIGIPININGYKFDTSTLSFSKERVVKKVVEFSTSATNPEFIIDYEDYDPPRIWVSGITNTEIGGDVTLTASGYYLPELFLLEEVGISDGEANQQFQLKHSPIDPDGIVEIYTYGGESNKWDVVTGLDSFSPVVSGLYEARLDPDFGFIEFGDYSETSNPTGLGRIPREGRQIFARYTPTIAVEYEPAKTTDEVIATTANVNPIFSSTNKGFVQVTTEYIDPDSISLSVSNITADTNDVYNIPLGNSTAKLVATVLDKKGSPIEGTNVIFEIIGVVAGSFGGSSTSVQSTTNSSGEAHVSYLSPLTILDVGKASTDITGNILVVDDLPVPTSLTEIYTYKIHDNDQVLGLPEADLDTYYSDYLVNEDIDTGSTATVDWEKDYRTSHNLIRPVTYTTAESDLNIGKKTILLTTSGTDTIDPHVGSFTTSGLTPLFPLSAVNIGTTTSPQLRMIFPISLPAIGVDNTKAYFVISNVSVQIRAYAISTRTLKKIYSNTISLSLNIPDTANGTYYVETIGLIGTLTRVRDINAFGDLGYIEDSTILLSSGVDNYYRNYLDERLTTLGVKEDYITWFRRTRLADTAGFEELSTTVTGFDPAILPLSILVQPGTIPLGFRMKSTGITLASALDQITYLDPNTYLPSGYYSV